MGLSKRVRFSDVFGVRLEEHIILEKIDLAYPISICCSVIREKGFGDKDLFYNPIDEAQKSELRSRMDNRFDPKETAETMKYAPEAAVLLLEYLKSIPGTLLGADAIEHLEKNISDDSPLTHHELKQAFNLKPLNLFNLKHLMKFFKDYFNSIKTSRSEILKVEYDLTEALFQGSLSNVSPATRVRVVEMSIEECEYIFDANIMNTMRYHIRQSLGCLAPNKSLDTPIEV
ncbi:unnamed protein product [Auanema sp. JU1783]|nr:unnamed protein product [Auanema sp. JU1783]